MQSHMRKEKGPLNNDKKRRSSEQRNNKEDHLSNDKKDEYHQNLSNDRKVEEQHNNDKKEKICEESIKTRRSAKQGFQKTVSKDLKTVKGNLLSSEHRMTNLYCIVRDSLIRLGPL